MFVFIADGDNGTAYRQHVQDSVQQIITPTRTEHIDMNHVKNGTSQDNQSPMTYNSEPIDTWIYPLVQMGPFNIKVDDKVTQSLFQKGKKDCQIMLASGYFNLTDHYENLILEEARANFDILTASPQVRIIIHVVHW